MISNEQRTEEGWTLSQNLWQKGIPRSLLLASGKTITLIDRFVDMRLELAHSDFQKVVNRLFEIRSLCVEQYTLVTRVADEFIAVSDRIHRWPNSLVSASSVHGLVLEIAIGTVVVGTMPAQARCTPNASKLPYAKHHWEEFLNIVMGAWHPDTMLANESLLRHFLEPRFCQPERESFYDLRLLVEQELCRAADRRLVTKRKYQEDQDPINDLEIEPLLPIMDWDLVKCYRPAYGRDHLWQKWNKEEGLTPAKIRDRWDAMTDHERRAICPGAWEKIGEASKSAGREVVKTGLKKANNELSS